MPAPVGALPSTARTGAPRAQTSVVVTDTARLGAPVTQTFVLDPASVPTAIDVADSPVVVVGGSSTPSRLALPAPVTP